MDAIPITPEVIFVLVVLLFLTPVGGNTRVRYNLSARCSSTLGGLPVTAHLEGLHAVLPDLRKPALRNTRRVWETRRISSHDQRKNDYCLAPPHHSPFAPFRSRFQTRFPPPLSLGPSWGASRAVLRASRGTLNQSQRKRRLDALQLSELPRGTL